MRRVLCCAAVGDDAPPTSTCEARLTTRAQAAQAASQVAAPPPAPAPLPPIVPAAADGGADAPYDTLLELSLLGAHPHPEALASPFRFRGVDFTRAPIQGRLRCKSDGGAADIFDWVGEWLREPAEAITLMVAGGIKTVSRAMAAGQSIASSGLASSRFAVVLVAPRCGICLEQRAPSPHTRHPALLAAGVQGVQGIDGWSCRAAGGPTPPHFFCRACMCAHLDALLARPGVPPPARLRCPQPGCTRALSDTELKWLIGDERLQAYTTARAAGHRGRLADVTSGREGGADLARWAELHAQACPVCAVLVERASGCAHMSCPCGAHFYWVKGMTAYP